MHKRFLTMPEGARRSIPDTLRILGEQRLRAFGSGLYGVSYSGKALPKLPDLPKIKDALDKRRSEEMSEEILTFLPNRGGRDRGAYRTSRGIMINNSKKEHQI